MNQALTSERFLPLQSRHGGRRGAARGHSLDVSVYSVVAGGVLGVWLVLALVGALAPGIRANAQLGGGASRFFHLVHILVKINILGCLFRFVSHALSYI